jgi:hypothetical protein
VFAPCRRRISAHPSFRRCSVSVVTKRLAVLAILLCASSAPVSAGTAVRTPSSGAATAAFGRYLHHRYGPVHGYWTCPEAQSSATGARLCEAEVRVALKRHHLWTAAESTGARIVFSKPTVRTWRRHWWPYSRHFIAGRGVHPRGVASVNSNAYYWWFLAQCATHVRPGGRERCRSEYGGHATGFLGFDRFECVGTHSLVRCHNRLGDVMRYKRRR